VMAGAGCFRCVPSVRSELRVWGVGMGWLRGLV
jgi:hypothetical protein